MARRPTLPVDRFWPKVDRSGGPNTCWPFTGGRAGKGYGQFYIAKSQPVGAHRFVYELVHGSIPDGLHICHHCDNPPCCNPSHLFVGTAGDNMRDKSRKGRNPGNPHSTGSWRKVSPAMAHAMADHIEAGETYAWVAQQYGVSAPTVLRQVRRVIRGAA